MCVNGTDLQVIEFRSCYGVTVSLINADRLDVKQFPLGKECFVGNNSANRKTSWSRKCINDFEDDLSQTAKKNVSYQKMLKNDQKVRSFDTTGFTQF